MKPFLCSTDYGAIGDGATNDYAALQAFLTDLGTKGGTGFLAPGQYYVSGGDLTITVGPGVPSVKLSAYGARITTDPTQPRIGLKVQRDRTAGHENVLRKLAIEGMHIDHFGNPGATYGMKLESAFHTVVRDVIIQAGGNGAGPSSNDNYQALCIDQTDGHDANTASFWNRIENVSIGGGAVKCPAGIVLHGQINATSITKCTFDYVNNAVLLYADLDGNITDSVRIIDNDFEQVDQCIMFASFIANVTVCIGLIASHNRVECPNGTFFYYRLAHNPLSEYPVMGPNTFIAGSKIYNPSGLVVVNY